jgi:hypothetical protein
LLSGFWRSGLIGAPLPRTGRPQPDDGGRSGFQPPDPAYGNTNPDNSGTHHGGGGGGGGGSSHHSCGFFGCHLSNFAHKAYHAVTQHPVIAAVIAGSSAIAGAGAAAVAEGAETASASRAATSAASSNVRPVVGRRCRLVLSGAV